MKKTVGIIGGGASGLAAAITAADYGAQVVILEKNDRIGKKILATGNGKCNLGNMNLSISNYYSDDLSLLEDILKDFQAKETISFFESLGLIIKNKNGYLYPLSEQASGVLDILRYATKQRPIEIRTQETVKDVSRTQSGTFTVVTDHKTYQFDRLIIACGGKAASKTGSDGSGYQLAKKFGHTITPIVPALVQLKCKETWFKSVSGVRCDAQINVLHEGKAIASDRGELQLTDYGISGIPVFQISRVVNRMLLIQNEVQVEISFLPNETENFADNMLQKRNEFQKGRTVEEYFTGILNKKLMQLLIKLAGLNASSSADKAPRAMLKRVYELCCKLTVTVNDNNSFENAQVCAGGIPLHEIDCHMQSKKVPGLYFSGEILDVDGKCGGYNLHWAWCSAGLAGKAAAKE